MQFQWKKNNCSSLKFVAIPGEVSIPFFQCMYATVGCQRQKKFTGTPSSSLNAFSLIVLAVLHEYNVFLEVLGFPGGQKETHLRFPAGDSWRVHARSFCRWPLLGKVCDLSHYGWRFLLWLCCCAIVLFQSLLCACSSINECCRLSSFGTRISISQSLVYGASFFFCSGEQFLGAFVYGRFCSFSSWALSL